MSTTEVTHLEHKDVLETVNVRLPEEILKVLDSLVERGLFSSRSEAIREFARQYVIESREANNG